MMAEERRPAKTVNGDLRPFVLGIAWLDLRRKQWPKQVFAARNARKPWKRGTFLILAATEQRKVSGRMGGPSVSAFWAG
jgi:hypothetical protein